jgi:hypothetical protein
MKTSSHASRLVPLLAVAAMALVALAAAGNAAAQGADYRNVTTGAPLKPGIYGRIAVRNVSAPPPVIYPQPVVANDALLPPGAQPVYLYVPPGQVRKWKQHCGKWSACEQPVLFVRVDDSPSRWGGWKKLREQVALNGRP